MRLILVQHGEAVSKDVDPDRPLSGEGRHTVERLAAFLCRLESKVTRVIHSGKTRAAQTAERLLWAVGSNLRPEARGGLGPNDPVEEAAEELLRSSEPVMLIGHLPFLGRLTGLLVCGSPTAELVQFTPGTALCLERDEAENWRIAWCLPPEVVPD